MAVIRPFRAVRPVKEKAHLVASVPYDVVNTEEAAELADGNPLSFLRVTRSEIELPSHTDPYDDSVYLKAKENFNRLASEAPLVQDETPRFYIYELTMGSQVQTGIAATFSVDDYDNNVIMKHEKTRKVKEDDRTNHIITTEVQTGAVFLTYKGVPAVNEIVKKTKAAAPEYDFTAPDGIKHKMWILPESENNIIIEAIAKVKNLYIADGHHRAASAGRTQKEMMKRNSAHAGNEEYNYFLAVLFPAEELRIMPYNRVVFKLNGMSKEQFFGRISENFSCEKTSSPVPPGKKQFCMYIDKQWFLLKPNSNVKEGKTVGENLDVSILQDYLLNPVLGIDDPRTSKDIDFIGGIRGTAELEKLVNNGTAEVAFSLYPVSLDDLINISDAGEIMPPKSTWFEPKLRDGLVIHKI
ncbi:MAG: DUF1015 domain-containing protein [Ignavibacteria bacterium]|nr:DUF1015 domain-containing protein [Ignavibacteria bacterium]